MGSSEFALFKICGFSRQESLEAGRADGGGVTRIVNGFVNYER
jgi:hypothetical protein